MVATDPLAFVRANLPAPPVRLLEVGAGDGALAQALSEAGYEVLAIDPEPAGSDVRRVALHELNEPAASFDAAVGAAVAAPATTAIRLRTVGLARTARMATRDRVPAQFGGENARPDGVRIAPRLETGSRGHPPFFEPVRPGCDLESSRSTTLTSKEIERSEL